MNSGHQRLSPFPRPPKRKRASKGRAASLRNSAIRGVPLRRPRQVLFAILISSVPLIAAEDTAPAAAIELLFPENAGVTYATIHGGVPLLAWRDHAEDRASIGHYEIWLDGEKVDEIPAGTFGDLPGEAVEEYEPFRPFGLLPGEQVQYYTPPLSRVLPGSHQWHVVAVDEDGGRRRSGEDFHFRVAEFGPFKVFVSHAGALAKQKRRVVADADVGVSRFEVLDSKGRVVSSGEFSEDGAFGEYLFADFEAPAVSGTFRIRAGSHQSMHFPVGLGARLQHESFLRKYRNAYRRKRCGDTTVNSRGGPCHLEDARMEGGRRHPITGGWHASSDVRKIMRILQPALHGLLEMKRVADPVWDTGENRILDEIRWGNRYIHGMQLANGALAQHYYLWCGATDWGESINRYTNNEIGDGDDRLLPESTLFIDMVSQSRFIRNQTAIHRLYKDVDPAYAAACLEAATRCHDHFEETWKVLTDYETSFNARPYAEPASDLMPLAYGVMANLAMYLSTGEPAQRNRAVVLADRLMALQETGSIGGQDEVRGFFYKDEERTEIFSSLMAHGGMDGVEGAVAVLADLCEALPDHPECPRWKESLRCYLEDCLLPLARKNAFGIVPAYLSLTDSAGGQTGAKMRRKIGGLHYQYLCDNRGANKALSRNAALLARGARILDRPVLRDAAWRQIDWIFGANPLNASTVYGVGHGQPRAYKAWLEPPTDGVLVQGIGGGDSDTPYLRQGHWRWCEMELHITAWFAEAVFELLRPPEEGS